MFIIFRLIYTISLVENIFGLEGNTLLFVLKARYFFLKIKNIFIEFQYLRLKRRILRLQNITKRLDSRYHWYEFLVFNAVDKLCCKVVDIFNGSHKI